MEEKIVYFDKPGIENTEEVLRIAKKRAQELGIKTIVVATTDREYRVRATEVFKGMKVVVSDTFDRFQYPQHSGIN